MCCENLSAYGSLGVGNFNLWFSCDMLLHFYLLPAARRSGLTPSPGEKVLGSESCVPSALFVEILTSLILYLKNLIAVLLYSCLKQACVIYMGKNVRGLCLK